MDQVWLIPAFPVAGFLLLVLAGRRLGDPKAGWLATLAVAGSFAASVALFLSLRSQPAESRQITETLWTWIPADSFQV